MSRRVAEKPREEADDAMRKPLCRLGEPLVLGHVTVRQSLEAASDPLAATAAQAAEKPLLEVPRVGVAAAEKRVPRSSTSDP